MSKDPIDRLIYEQELFHKFKDYQHFLIGYQDGYFRNVKQEDYDKAVEFMIEHIDRLRWCGRDN